MHAEFWWGYLKEKDYMEATGVKLKWILKKWDGSILWFHKILTVKTVADILNTVYDGRGTAVAQLVEALRYKSEGRGFDSRWCHWNFSLT